MKQKNWIFICLATLLYASIWVLSIQWWSTLCGIWLIWRVARLRTKRLMKQLFCVLILIGVRSSWLFYHVHHPVLGEASSTLRCDPYFTKINGNSWSGEAEVMETGERIYFYYTITSEDEKRSLEERKELIQCTVSGNREKPEKERNLHGFSFQRYLQAKEISTVYKIEKIQTIKKEQSLLGTFVAIKNEWIQRISNTPHQKASQYVQLLLFGNRSTLDEEVLSNFKKVGLLHLFAISGMHITLFARYMTRLFWRIGWTRERTTILVILLLLLYGWLLGWNSSATRAIFMFILSALYEMRYKKRLDALIAFCITLTVTLGWNVYQILSPVYVLSYSIAGSVLVLNSLGIRSVLSRTGCLFICSIPVLSICFYEIYPLGILLTGIASGVIGHIIYPSLLLYSICVLSGWESAGEIVGSLLSLVCTGIEQSVKIIWDIIPIRWVIGAGSEVRWMIYGLLVCTLLVVIEKKPIHWKKYVLGLVGIGAIWLIPYQPMDKAMSIDVGQGDATLFISKGYQTAVLVDTGGVMSLSQRQTWKQKKRTDHAQQTIIPVLKGEGIHTLQLVILTHADSDHMGNVASLHQEVPIQRIAIAKGMEDTDSVKQLMRQLKGVQWDIVHVPTSDTIGNARIQYVYPLQRSNGENETSLVALVDFMKRKWLLLGDVDQNGEVEMLRHFPSLTADIIKLGHHGSNTSTSKQLLERLQPKLSILSVGKNNRYGHPHKEVLSRLREKQLRSVRTDESGAIIYTQEGENLRVESVLTQEVIYIK